MLRDARLLVAVAVLGGCGRTDLDFDDPTALAARGDGGAADVPPDLVGLFDVRLEALRPIDAPAEIRPDTGPPPDRCGGVCIAGTRCVRGALVLLNTLRTGHHPDAIVAGKFDEDSAVDLVVANRDTKEADVFYGLGFGDFVFALDLDLGLEPRAFASGDFDNDGWVDLVSANEFVLAFWTNTGRRKFGPGHSYSVTGSPGGITAADLDGNGGLDLVVIDATHDDLAIFPGDRFGNFSPPYGPSGIIGEPAFVAAADLDHDARVDLVIANPATDSVSTLMNLGGGRFSTERRQPVLADPTHVALADFDGDGNFDAAINDQGSLSVLLGDGRGGWRTAVRTPARAGVGWVTAADFDGDGRHDVVVSGQDGLPGNDHGFLQFWRGQGDGSFGAPQTFLAGSLPRAMVTPDLDGDGHPDLIAADYVEDVLRVYMWRDQFECH